uniref:Invertase inhibitor n=1 Tax=Solanum tuberosum TaxID=4113 RepID=M1DDW9_SOLTU
MKLMKMLIVIFFVSLFFVARSYGDLIDDVCKKSDDYKLCVNSLRADPRSSSADKKGLAHIMLQLSLAKANVIYNQTLILLKKPMESILKQCIQICRDNYVLAVLDISNAIKYLDENDLDMAKSEATIAIECPVTCEDSFTEWRPIRKNPFKKENDDFLHFNHVMLNLLDPL